MRRSIRIKLFIGVIGLIIFFVLFSWVLNTNYLVSYYEDKKKNILVEAYNLIDRTYKGDPDEISLELEKLDRTSGLSIVIISRDYSMIYDSRVSRLIMERDLRRRIYIDMPLVIPKIMDIPRGKYIIETARDPRLNTNFLNLFSVLNNGDILIISTPLAAIKESADIANDFFLITGILTIVIGSIVVYILSRKFTSPILELNDIAQRMSKLDFSKKYNVRSKDEIGELGNSINSLSDQLDKSITELREANKKLTQDIERERKIDEMRKEFISNVSHELKTPITLIQGYAEGLKLNVNDDEESKNFYCDVIVDEANKMNKLIKDLLDLSQIDSGNFKLERCTFDISSLIHHVLNKFDPIFKEKNIDVQVDRNGDFDVNGDIVRIEQVLFNYINNAINHIDDKKIIRIGIIERCNKVRVTVYNSGKHIPEEFLDKIWISFYKVDKARTRSYGGTGLGLSIVRAIQELHNNSYGVNNVEDGVEFWFELDRA